MKKPWEMTEDEFVADPTYRATCALTKAMKEIGMPEEDVCFLVGHFLAVWEAQTDEDLRVRYRASSSQEVREVAEERVRRLRQRQKSERGFSQ